MNVKIIVLVLSGSLLIASVLGQPYSVDWHKIAGGGGSSTNGQFTLSGAIGQHDAGLQMSGGNFSVTGGYWVFPVSQTPGAPLLSIKLAGSNTVMIYWPSPSTGFNLQVNTNLAGTNWTGVPQTVNDDGTNRYILIAPPIGGLYYRLKE